MTLGDQITYSERRARVSANASTISTASDVTVAYINEGVREFCKGVGGIPKIAYLQLSPKFDVQSNWAWRLTMAGGANAFTVQDVVIAATNHQGLTAASTAAYIGGQLSNNLSASVSVSWNAASWTFSVYDEIGSATSWQVAEPVGISYVNAVDRFLNTTGTQTATYFQGQIPQDLVLETALPSDFLMVQNVEWNDNPLSPAPIDLFLSPTMFGTPTWYAIKEGYIRVSPVPDSQELFTLYYLGMETDLSTSTATCPLPADYHWAPIFYASHMLAQENHDWDVSQQNFGLFLNEVKNYKTRKMNQNFAMRPRDGGYRPIKVVTST